VISVGSAVFVKHSEGGVHEAVPEAWRGLTPISQPAPEIIHVVFMTPQLTKLPPGRNVPEKDKTETREVQDAHEGVAGVPTGFSWVSCHKRDPIIAITRLEEGGLLRPTDFRLKVPGGGLFQLP